jgi:hypothetical protein
VQFLYIRQMPHFRLPSEIGDSKNEWFTNILYPMSQTPGPREPENGYGGDPGTLSQN